MGIESLLKYTKTKKVSIDKLSYNKVFIDISCWIHKAKFANECNLALNPNSNDFLHVLDSMLSRLDNSKIIVCFDGETPEIKRETYEKRRKGNDIAIKRAELIIQTSKNKGTIYKAKRDIIMTLNIKTLFQKTKDFLDARDTKWVQADYESDEKIAKLATESDLIISDDSDFIPLGCENVLYKYDYKSGIGDLYNRSTSQIVLNDEIRRIKDFKLLVEFCVLSGCDYFKYPKIGIKSAWKICLNYTNLKSFINNLDDESRAKFKRATAQFNTRLGCDTYGIKDRIDTEQLHEESTEEPGETKIVTNKDKDSEEARTGLKECLCLDDNHNCDANSYNI